MNIGNRLCSLIEDHRSGRVLSASEHESWTSANVLPSRDRNNIISLVVRALDDARVESCHVVSLRKKMRKMFFEVEVHDKAEAGSYIGKIYSSDRGQTHFDALQTLRNSGFCPPARLTVVHPVAYLEEHCMLIQEKAPGRPLADFIHQGDSAASAAVHYAAQWLAKLHGVTASGRPRLEAVAAAVTRYGSELAALLPQHSARLERLTSLALVALLTPGQQLVSSHGDYHSKNVYITAEGRVTVIDLDTFGQQERAADVAYFLAQTAIMDYHHHGSFVASEPYREGFWNSYQDAAPPIPDERLALYMAIAFLQSLHYELCVLRTANFAITEIWLSNAERFLIAGEVAILDSQSATALRQPA